MKLVRFCGCLVVLAGLDSATAARAAPPSKASAGQVAPPIASGNASPLTAPPSAVPPVLWKLDLSRLAHGLTVGTAVKLEPANLVSLSPLPGVSVDRPLIIAASFDVTQLLVGWQPLQSAALKLGPESPRLQKQGWAALNVPSCAQKTAKSGVVVGCGTEDALLSFGDSLSAAVGPLAPENSVEGELDARSFWSEWVISGSRDKVPSQVDAILSPPALGKSVSLRLSLYDLGLAFATRFSEASRELSQVQVALHIDEQAVGHYRLRVPVGPRSTLSGVLNDAHERPGPPILAQLPDQVDSAWWADSSLVRALLSPSARALTLLSKAHEDASVGPFADALAASASACLVPRRSFVGVAGSAPANATLPATKAKATDKGAKQQVAETFEDEPASHHYSAIALEDPTSRCAASLGTLLKLYSAASLGNESPQTELLKAGKGVPKASWVLRLGKAEQFSYAASWSDHGYTWLGWADTLPALDAAFSALHGSNKKAAALLTPGELERLQKAPALLGALLRPAIFGAAQGVEALPNEARVPFLLTRVGPELVAEGSIPAPIVRRRGAALLTQMWDKPDWGAGQNDTLVKLLDATCHLGAANACNTLGVHYGDGLGVAKDTNRAHEYLAIGCAAGQGTACLNSGFYDASPTEQRKAFRKACELKSPSGCAWHGKLLLESSDVDVRRQAIPRLEFACTRGSGFGCWQLAAAYATGTGVAEDEEKAFGYEYRSCSLSFGAGCVAQGNSYLKGVGGKPNPEFAFKSYEYACKLDKESGCYALGVAYARGIGCAKDMRAARAQWTIACDAGHAEACRMLAESSEAP